MMSNQGKKDGEAPTQNQAQDTAEGPRSFARFVAAMAEGEAEQQLSFELHELAKRMQEQASAQADKVKGSLILKINFIAEPKGFVGVSYDVSVAVPKPKRPASMFWLTKGGNLTEQNPRQLEMGLKEVPTHRPGAFREVGTPPSPPAE